MYLVGERGGYRLTHHAPTLHIPTTVQGVLAARIDRLRARRKSPAPATRPSWGVSFRSSLVRQVVPQSEDELYRVLASLQRKEFLYEQPAFPEVEYIFKHALTQEVAYNSVLHGAAQSPARTDGAGDRSTCTRTSTGRALQ